MSAIATGFFILWLALAMWVYFDATEHGKPAIPWTLAVFLLGWALLLPLILYVIFRDTGYRWAVPPGGGRRLYLYVVGFAGVVMLAIGISLLTGTTIARALSEDAVSDDGYRESVASALAAIIIGAGVWASHWFRTEGRLAFITDDQEFRSTFFLHRAYLYTVLGLFWIFVFIFGLWFLGGMLANLLDVEGAEPEGWLPAVGPLLVALLLVGYHLTAHLQTSRYREAQARFEKIPGPLLVTPSGQTGVPALAGSAGLPPAPPVREEVAPAQAERRHFCRRCGEEARAEDAFCGACSARL